MCEAPSVYGCENPKARKGHRCCECRGAIKVGEKYFRHHGIWDGSASTFKICDDCEDLRNRLDSGTYDPDEAIPLGYLDEVVFEGQGMSEVVEFIAIKIARSADVSDWMYRVLAERHDAETLEREGR